ncbi:YgfZ/GcvT domain-containing protein [Canibacter zhuwentaonis]|uniref:CAF17-like 4Fe-4S cluster assembly/insertion protein YgfZ n=1 Tax=Canibacter zhuwentaonis TaxID=2837491 RepID=UPI002028FE6A|nr:hypothetical protein [Canibacter zhuwentaonis]
MRSELFKIPQAVLDSSGDAVLHYGSPFAESRHFSEGRALVSRTDLAVLKLAGTDALKILHSQTTQKLDSLQPGQSAETLLLSPQGKIIAQLAIVHAGDCILITLLRAQAQEIVDYFTRMRFTFDYQIADSSETLFCADICAPRAALKNIQNCGALREADLALCDADAALREADLAGSVPIWGAIREFLSANNSDITAIWCDPWVFADSAAQISYYRGGEHPAATGNGTVRLILDAKLLAELVRGGVSNGLRLAGTYAVAAHEIALWRPSLADFDERSLPHEYDLLRSSVHLNKGCYRGQETVAKVHNLGHPPRRLVFLHLDGSDAILPVAGDKIFAAHPLGATKSAPELAADLVRVEVSPADAKTVHGGAEASPATERPIGIVTRAIMHYELGAIGLGLVKRTAKTTDSYAIVTSSGATVRAAPTVIVPPDAGATQALDPLLRQQLLRRQ